MNVFLEPEVTTRPCDLVFFIPSLFLIIRIKMYFLLVLIRIIDEVYLFECYSCLDSNTVYIKKINKLIDI
jgi:hypothetical protein